MIPKETKDWLKEHNKGDLQECTWEELKEALAASGRGCPLADEHSSREYKRRFNGER